MVHAADIGKASKDFLKKDFFAGNEFKVTQVSNSRKKNNSVSIFLGML